jgi:hypothetical protein
MHGQFASTTIQPLIRLLLCLVFLAAVAAPGRAEDATAAPLTNIDWPSPDGKFAFRTSYGEDLQAIDLADKTSGKALQRIDEEDSSQASWHVLWAADYRFALMTRLGHPIQGVDIYFRSGETFQKIDLPDLPSADIPEKLKRGKNFPHVANDNWQEAKEWKKDGSLVVTIETMIDGDSGSIDATRTVTLRFDPSGRAMIGTSAIRYKTGKN